MTMRVPKTLSEEKLNQIRRLVRSELSLEEISIAVKLPILDFQYEAEQFAEELKHEKEQAEIDKHKYLMYSHDQETLLKYLNADMTIEELANITNKHDTTIANQLRDWRNALAHKQHKEAPKGLTSQQISRIMKLGSDVVWNSVTKKSLNQKRVKINTIKKSLNNLQKGRYVLDEWWNFGQIVRIRNHPDSITFQSADANSIKLIKQYTPHWKDILMKARGLKDRFVAMHVVQNYENTEPRLTDITASEGIMSMAKTYPMDTRKQSFAGRYSWQYFGHYEAKVFNDTMYIVNADGWIASYPMGNPDDALEVKVINTIDMTEGEPLLICVDGKNPVDSQGITIIADVHAEKDGYEVYAEDHNTILEQIAMTKDAAEEKRKELALQKREIETKKNLIKQKADESIRKLEAQSKTTEQAELQMNAELERELRDFERQEHFLSETKEALHDYKVRIMAEERDRQGDKPVAFQMDGLSIMPRQFKSRDLTAALRKLHDTMQRRSRREGLLSEPVEQAAPPIKQSDDITTSDFIIDQAIAEKEAQEAAAMFDDSAEAQMPDFAKQILAKMESITSFNAALLNNVAMTDIELQNLRTFVREEEEELEAGNKKAAAEEADIMNRIQEIVGQTIDCKVNNGHPKNSFLLRQNINLYEQKISDRVHVQFMKHLYGKVFKVYLPHHNKEAMLSIVRDSEDAADIAIKNVMSLHGQKWKDIEPEVTGFGGKRLVGKKATPAKLLGWHKEICERLGVEVQ